MVILKVKNAKKSSIFEAILVKQKRRSAIKVIYNLDFLEEFGSFNLVQIDIFSK